MSTYINTVTNKHIKDYQKNGVVVLHGVFKDWIPTLIKGADYNLENPSANALLHSGNDEEGRFLEDFCRWQDIPEYKEFIYHSPMAEIAAKLMKSRSVQFFHDHYLHKEASSGIATPWHQDMPYYCVEGEQTVSFWIPLNARAKEISLKCVQGSHSWPREIRPTSWSSMESFYEDDSNFMDLPDIDAGGYDIKAWAMEPGDVLAFNFKLIHGANAPSVSSSNWRDLTIIGWYNSASSMLSMLHTPPLPIWA